jgi:hypothetical protein
MQAVLHEVPTVMHERVQVEDAAAIDRQEHAPQGPKISAVGPVLSKVCVAWILAPCLEHDKVQESPQPTICVPEIPIAETKACRGPSDDLSSVGPHLSDDLLDLRDPALVLLCKDPALIAVQRHLVPTLGFLGAHKLVLKAQMRLASVGWGIPNSYLIWHIINTHLNRHRLGVDLENAFPNLKLMRPFQILL